MWPFEINSKIVWIAKKSIDDECKQTACEGAMKCVQCNSVGNLLLVCVWAIIQDGFHELLT